jgi:two-component sensor histidine kinase
VLDELRHRLRNKVAVVQAVLRHELRADAELRARVLDRLNALAHADELLTGSEHDTVDLRDIFRVELSLYGGARFSAQGDPVRLPPRLAATLTLVVHELATNAVKYGAFKHRSGLVSIGWRLDSRTLTIEWSESGGPSVCKPERNGFGTRLFRCALDPFHGAIEMAFEPAGLRCKICLDIPAPSAEGDAARRLSTVAGKRSAATVFGGLRANIHRIRQGAFAALIALALMMAGLGFEKRSDLSRLATLHKIETALRALSD